MHHNREIGSEFWLDDVKEYDEVDVIDWLPNGSDRVLLLSGRTAIDFVLQDIVSQIRTAYMPSYCCSSMLQPFVDRGIDLEFYDVTLSDTGLSYVIDYNKTVDLFFATSYFGFQSTTMDSATKHFRQNGTIVIEDITHRLLCGQNHCESADYLVASLRKWFPTPSGGLATKMNGSFNTQRLLSPSVELIAKKVRAMRKKAEYIRDSREVYDDMDKQHFLALYFQFNEGLRLRYEDQRIDDLSLNILSNTSILDVQVKRRLNGKYLHSGLDSLEHIRPLIPWPDFENDCPLFVPITIRRGLRDSLRNYLSQHDVFCPVHWPVPKSVMLTATTASPYEETLSLVCDQRYGGVELARLLDLLGEFEKTI